MLFVGREQYIDKLQLFLARPEAEIAVVYGRRRIGKTSLIEHAISKFSNGKT